MYRPLPEGLTMSRMYMNGTLRSWIHYIELRTDPSTQKEHREVAQMCAFEIARVFPLIKEIVTDPQTADKLCPKYHIGGKRLCVDTGYFETFNKVNVHLIDLLSSPIKRIGESLIEADQEYDIDTLILATGFDAMTGALTSLDIVGRNGIILRDQWKQGAKSYLGLGVSNFPNLFTITGPGSPSVLSNMMPSIEQHLSLIHI